MYKLLGGDQLAKDIYTRQYLLDSEGIFVAFPDDIQMLTDQRNNLIEENYKLEKKLKDIEDIITMEK